MKKEMIPGTRKALAGLTIRTPKDPLTALDIALAAAPDQGPPESDEFTVDDYVAARASAGVKVAVRTARDQLKALVESGALKSRKGSVDGKTINIFSKP